MNVFVSLHTFISLELDQDVTKAHCSRSWSFVICHCFLSFVMVLCHLSPYVSYLSSYFKPVLLDNTWCKLLLKSCEEKWGLFYLISFGFLLSEERKMGTNTNRSFDLLHSSGIALTTKPQFRCSITWPFNYLHECKRRINVLKKESRIPSLGR